MANLGTEPGHVRDEGRDEPGRIERAVERCPMRASGRPDPGPALADLSRIEPVGAAALLPLPGYRSAKRVRLLLTDRDARDTFPPEADIDSRRVAELGGELRVALAARDAELVEGLVLARGDLGRQHPGRGPPRLTELAAALEHEHPAPLERELARAGGSERPASDDDNVITGRHLEYL